MHDNGALVEARIEREIVDRVRPLLHARRAPLTVEAGPSLDELAPLAVVRSVGVTRASRA